MGSEEIKNLPDLLKNYLGTSKQIHDVKITRLTAPGENFGSVMLKLDITVLNTENGTKEILHAVGKTLPETELFREIFNVQMTYRYEMAFYEIIVPAVQDFQRRLGITQVFDTVCKCIATRKNLDGSDKIDDDAVIVLENLMELGYKNIERIEGFDFETTKLIIRDLALFHGVFIAMKNKEPEIFAGKIKPYCHDFKVVQQENDKFQEVVNILLNENEDTGRCVSKIKTWGTIPRSAAREPFATVIHCDLWINNIMQKFENGKAVANKIVDFQCFNYGSPAADLFFFLWTSVSQALLESHLDYFIKYYYENLLEVLVQHECDTGRFTFEQFQKEIELETDYEIGHALLFIIFTLNGKSEDDTSTEVLSTEEMLARLLPKTKKRVHYMIRECVKHGWLK
nr:uncharacterized protein LOC111503102 [Leptinotarsa decemlineata]